MHQWPVMLASMHACCMHALLGAAAVAQLKVVVWVTPFEGGDGDQAMEHQGVSDWRGRGIEMADVC